jgi:hypothetical protein
MEKISITGMKDAIRFWAIAHDEPCLFRGRFGVGKTVGAEQVVAELNEPGALAALGIEDMTGCVQCDIRLGQYDSVDMRGFPGVSRTTGQTIWHAPSTMPFVGNDQWPDDKIILMTLDEITSATPPVFANAYQLINERRLGEHILKSNVRIVAMGNLASDKGIVNRMPMPLLNRMTQFEIVVSVDDWCHWAIGQGIPPLFIAFLKFRPNLLCTYDPAKSEDVVATPRTWEKAAVAYRSTMNDHLKRAVMQGLLGEGPALEMWGFKEIWSKVVPIKRILENPATAPIPTEAAMQYATTVSVSGAMSPKTTAPLYAYLQRFDKPEFPILAWQLAVKRDGKVMQTPEFLEFAARYKQVFA